MVVVYLKNGEKAPLPDANYVRVEAAAQGGGTVLRCLYGDQEVGVFKWDEVAGYSIAVLPAADISPASAYDAWQRVQQP